MHSKDLFTYVNLALHYLCVYNRLLLMLAFFALVYITFGKLLQSKGIGNFQIDQHSLKAVSHIGSSEFERLVARLLESLGYKKVYVNGGPGDRGADIFCYDARGLKVVVQCKRYGTIRKVGSDEMQKFLGCITDFHASYGIFVTTSGFTSQATDYAKRHNIVLIDGRQLSAFLINLRRNKGRQLL